MRESAKARQKRSMHAWTLRSFCSSLSAPAGPPDQDAQPKRKESHSKRFMVNIIQLKPDMPKDVLMEKREKSKQQRKIRKSPCYSGHSAPLVRRPRFCLFSKVRI